MVFYCAGVRLIVEYLSIVVGVCGQYIVSSKVGGECILCLKNMVGCNVVRACIYTLNPAITESGTHISESICETR